MASPEIHAKCGASNAHRYLVCTASPTFEAQFPVSTSVYAEEGTLAHSICELFVKTRGDVDAMAEELRPLQRNKLYQPEMLTCAKVYCDWIMEKALHQSSGNYDGAAGRLFRCCAGGFRYL